MKYEKINKNYTKTIIISIIAIVIIGSVLVLNITKAKYKTTISVPIVNGTVKYSDNADLNVIAVYQQKDDAICTDEECYDIKDDIPEKVYKINKEKSFCSSTGNTISNKDDSIVIEYDSYNGKINVLNLTKKGTKCYLYFDKRNGPSDKILANLNIYSQGEVEDFSKTACGGSCDVEENGVFETEDDFGTSYYFRGTINNNWVKFGKDSTDKDIWWRIVRINGDGSIRLIYAGTSNNNSAPDLTNTQMGVISTQGFNGSLSNNTYVGFEYKSGDAHGFGQGATDSNAYIKLRSWFEDNLKEEWNEGNGMIDLNAGFCNDRSSSSNISGPDDNGWVEDMIDSEGTINTYYGAYIRLERYKQPTLKCSTTYNNGDGIINKNKDYFTYTGAAGIKQNGTDVKITGTQSLDYPIGLITVDEVVFAGGVPYKINSNFWLKIGSIFWTMSPAFFDSANKFPQVFYLNTSGIIGESNVTVAYGLRPVINLKSDTKFTFAHPDQPLGTSTNPYIVS